LISRYSTNEPANKLTNQQTNHPTNQQTNQPTSKPTNQPTNKLTNQQTNKQTNKPDIPNGPTQKNRNFSQRHGAVKTSPPGAAQYPG
jgi:hypothetical protein